MGGSGVLSSFTRYAIESLPKDAPLPEGNTSGSAEGSMLQKELTELCTKFSCKKDTTGIDGCSSAFYLTVLMLVEILPNRGGEK